MSFPYQNIVGLIKVPHYRVAPQKSLPGADFCR